MIDVTTINRDPGRLMPEFATRMVASLADCHAAGYPVDLFEGYRCAERQDWLYQSGRKRSGKKVTNAKGWESWHQYAVAGDFAFRINGKWSWEGDFDKVAHFFEEHGLEWGNALGEKVHFQLTGGLKISRAYQIAQNEGLKALWAEIAAKL